MIKFETSNGKTNLSITGTFDELMADSCLFVKCMYKSIEDKDKIAGRLYKDFAMNHMPKLAFKEAEDLFGDESLEKMIDRSRELLDELEKILKDEKKENK